MNRPRLIRGLRIAWSVWWGILCVLLVVLWVRSYLVARRGRNGFRKRFYMHPRRERFSTSGSWGVVVVSSCQFYPWTMNYGSSFQ